MAHRFIFTDSVLPDSISQIGGTTSLYNYAGQAGVVLKRVNSLAEAAACGGVMLFFRHHSVEGQQVTPQDYRVEVGYCGAALRSFFDPVDPVVGWQVEASLRGITNNIRVVHESSGLQSPDLEIAYKGVTPVRYSGSQLVQEAPDMTILVFGWFTRAATGVLTNLPNVGGVGGDTAMRMSLQGRNSTVVLWPDAGYAGGLVCQAPVPIKWRALLADARSGYLTGASGDALQYLTLAYDELLAKQPVDKTVLQPVVVHFNHDGSMRIGHTTPSEAYAIDQLDNLGLDQTMVGSIQSLISSNGYYTGSPVEGVSRIKISDGYGRVLGGVPIPGFGFNGATEAPVMTALPGQINGVQAAAMLASAFPVNYGTKYGVDEAVDFDLNQILHPMASEVVETKTSVSSVNGVSTYSETPQSATTIRMSWQDAGPGVFGTVMSFLNAVDQLAKKKAKG